MTRLSLLFWVVAIAGIFFVPDAVLTWYRWPLVAAALVYAVLSWMRRYS